MPRRTSHADAPVVERRDVKDAARQIHRHLLVVANKPLRNPNGNGRTGTCSTRQGDADATFPNDEVDRSGFVDRELNVRARCEVIVSRHPRSYRIDDRSRGRPGRNGVGISCISKRELPRVTVVHSNVQDYLTDHAHLPHVDSDLPSPVAIVNEARTKSSIGVEGDLKDRLLVSSSHVECRAPQAVAAHLRN